MIISLKEAFAEQQTLVAFNFCNIETCSAILEGAKNKNKIVVLSFGEQYSAQIPIPVVAAIAKAYAQLYKMPFVLHLDHSTSIETVKMAIELGFSSIMFDGSHLPLNENIRLTSQVVKLAKQHNVSVEGELGYLNKEDGSNEVEIVYTSVADSATFAKATEIDALAIAVGNAHGVYKNTPHIAISRIKEIYSEIQLPLVLHGSSGIDKSVLLESFKNGIRKINVNTELSLAGAHGAYQYISNYNGKARLENALIAAKIEMQTVVEKFLDI